jgi:hypothetical protein
MTSPDFWVILRGLTGNAENAQTVFEILEGVAVGSPPTIMADNYESAVKLLNDFASAGSVGSTVEQKQDKRARRGQQPPKQEKPLYVFIPRSCGLGANLFQRQSSCCQRREGNLDDILSDDADTGTDGAISPREQRGLGSLLVSYLPSSYDPVHEPVPRDTSPIIFLITAVITLS